MANLYSAPNMGVAGTQGAAISEMGQMATENFRGYMSPEARRARELQRMLALQMAQEDMLPENAQMRATAREAYGTELQNRSAQASDQQVLLEMQKNIRSNEKKIAALLPELGTNPNAMAQFLKIVRPGAEYEIIGEGQDLDNNGTIDVYTVRDMKTNRSVEIPVRDLVIEAQTLLTSAPAQVGSALSQRDKEAAAVQKMYEDQLEHARKMERAKFDKQLDRELDETEGLPKNITDATSKAFAYLTEGWVKAKDELTGAERWLYQDGTPVPLEEINATIQKAREVGSAWQQNPTINGRPASVQEVYGAMVGSDARAETARIAAEHIAKNYRQMTPEQLTAERARADVPAEPEGPSGLSWLGERLGSSVRQAQPLVAPYTWDQVMEHPVYKGLSLGSQGLTNFFTGMGSGLTR